MNFSHLLDRYLEHQKPSASVVAVLRLSWPKFVKFCRARGLADGNEITPTVLEDFYKGLLWEPNDKGQWYKANSVDQFIRRVRQVLRWSAAHDLIQSDPTVGLLLPRPVQPVRKPLTWQELQILLQTPDRSTPLGLRDALLLQLLTESELIVTQLVLLTEDFARQLELEAATRLLLNDYLELARPVLIGGRADNKLLIIGKFGEALGAPAVAARLNEMARQAGLGRRLPTRILRQSYQAALQSLRERQPLSPLTDLVNRRPTS